MESKSCVIVLGDVVQSSKSKGVQRILHDAVASANEGISSEIVAPFEITRGDEIAIVTEVGYHWFSCIQRFTKLAMPLKIRWVVIIGLVNEGSEFRSSAEMTGPGFVLADSTMRELKKTEMLFSFKSVKEDLNEELSGFLNLYLVMLNNLTPFQIQVFRFYQKYKTQKVVAAKLQKTQQQVQKTLKAINWESIDSAEKAIETYLGKIMDKFKEQLS